VTGRFQPGSTATRWISGALVCLLAGVGGLVEGEWWAAAFIPLALALAYMARKAEQRGDL
jgi:hypothetical protein